MGRARSCLSGLLASALALVCAARAGAPPRPTRCSPSSGPSPTGRHRRARRPGRSRAAHGVARRGARHRRAARPPRPRRERLDEPRRGRRQRPRRRPQRLRRRRPRREHVRPQRQRRRRQRPRHARRRDRRRARRATASAARASRPSATILPVKVLDADMAGNTDTLARGIRYAVDRGAKILNVSVNTDVADRTDPRRRDATPAQHGAIIVASAGNNGRNIDLLPVLPRVARPIRPSSPSPRRPARPAVARSSNTRPAVGRPRGARRADRLDGAARPSRSHRHVGRRAVRRRARWRCCPPRAPTFAGRRCATSAGDDAASPASLGTLLGGELDVGAAMHRALPGRAGGPRPRRRSRACACAGARRSARAARDPALVGDRRPRRGELARLPRITPRRDTAGGRRDRAATSCRAPAAATAGRSSASTPRARRSCPRRARCGSRARADRRIRGSARP